MRAFLFAALLASVLAQDVSTTRARVTVTFVPTVTVLTTETVVVIPELAPVTRNTTVCESGVCRLSTASLTFLPPTTFYTTLTLSSYKTDTSSITDATVSIIGTRTYTSFSESTITKVITGANSTTTVELTRETTTVSSCAHDSKISASTVASTDTPNNSSNDTRVSSTLPVTTITVYPIPAQATATIAGTDMSGNLSITYTPARSEGNMGPLTINAHSLSTLRGQNLESITPNFSGNSTAPSSTDHVCTTYGNSSTTAAIMDSTSPSRAKWTPKMTEHSTDLSISTNSASEASTSVMTTLQPSVYRSAGAKYQPAYGIFNVMVKVFRKVHGRCSFT